MCRRKQRQNNSMVISSHINTFSADFTDKKCKNDIMYMESLNRRKSESTYISAHMNSPKGASVCPKPEAETLLKTCEEGAINANEDNNLDNEDKKVTHESISVADDKQDIANSMDNGKLTDE